MEPMLYPQLFKAFESVRWDMTHDVPWAAFDGARLSDEQAQTIKMNAITEWSALPGHGDVPARQPPGQRFLRVHVDLVLRGAEARAGADGIPAPVPPGIRADGGRAPRGALRIRSGPGRRDADAAFLRRDPAQPLVPLRRRMAHGAGDQEDLRTHLPGRGAARRRLPSLHEARDRTRRRRGQALVREDRRADGELVAHPQAAASRPICT